MQTKDFRSFSEFYPFYLAEHSDRRCRGLHFIGTTLVAGILLGALLTLNPWWLLLTPLAGYGFAWVGHFFFEKNRPATFRNPFYSFAADWVMWFEILAGRRGLSGEAETTVKRAA